MTRDETLLNIIQFIHAFVFPIIKVKSSKLQKQKLNKNDQKKGKTDAS